MQVHLYGPGTNLHARILDAASALGAYGKPMLLGESGLDWRVPDGTTATTSVNGPLATRHAVWAALVSGFMNGRALWWEDGYAILQNGDPSVPFVTGYPAVESSVLAFLNGRDLAGKRAVPLELSSGFEGGVIGDERIALGWIHDAACGFPQGVQPPSCPALAGMGVWVGVPGTGSSWEASFHDPRTGAAMGALVVLPPDGGGVFVPLPRFADDIAFVLTAIP